MCPVFRILNDRQKRLSFLKFAVIARAISVIARSKSENTLLQKALTAIKALRAWNVFALLRESPRYSDDIRLLTNGSKHTAWWELAVKISATLLELVKLTFLKKTGLFLQAGLSSRTLVSRAKPAGFPFLASPV
ncbi:hypothetical protein [Bartonella choladocola]|uniref:Uncharacterized protein n=1 Tax=Bartonella choladocola TaxID=2750995 RepID=A0A1U9MK48_9HYPH|nr:hypothetical protein [Bartonella choladocola]AQT48100.1 hypothetical protein BBC0122_020070 [Bartonella choladocola]